MATQTRAPTSDYATGGTVAYSSGTTGYNLVNDYPDTADPLASYVRFGTTTNSFIAFNYTAFDVPSNATIISVAVQYTDEEPATGNNSAAGRLRIGGTYYDSSTHQPAATTTSRVDVWTNNPATSAPWTVAEVNGTDGTNPLQNFGVIGPDSNPVWQIGSIQLVVNYSIIEERSVPDGVYFSEPGTLKEEEKPALDTLFLLTQLVRAMESLPYSEPIMLGDSATTQVAGGAPIDVQVSWVEFDVKSGGVENIVAPSADGVYFYEPGTVEEQEHVVIDTMFLLDQLMRAIERLPRDDLLLGEPSLTPRTEFILDRSLPDALMLGDTVTPDVSGGPQEKTVSPEADGVLMKDGVTRELASAISDAFYVSDLLRSGIDVRLIDKVMLPVMLLRSADLVLTSKMMLVDAQALVETRKRPVFYSRPKGDIENAGWVPSSGSDLYAMLDEATPDDGDYISGAGSAGYIGIDTMPDPGVDAGFTLSFRAWCPTDNGFLYVNLEEYDPASEEWVFIGGRNFPGTLPSTHATYTYVFTEAEIAAITDFSQLAIHVGTIINQTFLSWVEIKFEKDLTADISLLLDNVPDRPLLADRLRREFDLSLLSSLLTDDATFAEKTTTGGADIAIIDKLLMIEASALNIEKVLREDMLVVDAQIIEKLGGIMLQLSDGILLDDRVARDALLVLRDAVLLNDALMVKELLRALYDALLLSDSVDASPLRGDLDRLIQEGVLLSDAYSLLSSRAALFRDSLFLSDQRIGELLRQLRETMMLSDARALERDLSATASLLLDDIISRMWTLTLTDGLFSEDVATQQWYGVVLEFLVYARLDFGDPIGITVSHADPIGIETSHNAWRVEA